MSYIHETALIKNSSLGDVKVYRNSIVNDSVLSDDCSIGDDTVVVRSKLDKSVIINRRNYINDCTIGKYSYTGLNTIIRFTNIGKFCSIAPNVDIGGVDHDYKKVTTIPEFRFRQMMGEAVIPSSSEKYGTIGNDVWIATGAIVLRKCKIGDGAIVGAGAVVTKDVPPYAIVAGVPAKIIGYRFPKEYIDRLLKIKWWDFSDELISQEIYSLINADINDDILCKLEKLGGI